MPQIYCTIDPERHRPTEPRTTAPFVPLKSKPMCLPIIIISYTVQYVTWSVMSLSYSYMETYRYSLFRSRDMVVSSLNRLQLDLDINNYACTDERDKLNPSR